MGQPVLSSSRNRRRLLPEAPPVAPSATRLARWIWCVLSLLLFLAIVVPVDAGGLQRWVPSLPQVLDLADVYARLGVVAGFFAICAGILALPATTGPIRLAMATALLGLAAFPLVIGHVYGSLDSASVGHSLFLLPALLLGASAPMLFLRYTAGWQINLPQIEPPDRRPQLTLNGLMMGIALVGLVLAIAQRAPESSSHLLVLVLAVSAGTMMVSTPLIAWLLISAHYMRAFLVIHAMTALALVLVAYSPTTQPVDMVQSAHFLFAFVGFWTLAIVAFRLQGGHLCTITDHAPCPLHPPEPPQNRS